MDPYYKQRIGNQSKSSNRRIENELLREQLKATTSGNGKTSN